MCKMTDQDKLNNLYSRITGFEFPECIDPLYQQVIEEIREGFQIIQKGLLTAADNIKNAKNNE